MKSLLVPAENNTSLESTLETADLFARTYASKIDGVALRMAQFQAVGAEPIVAVTFPPNDELDAETLQSIRARFETFARVDDRAGRFRWRAGDPVDDGELGALARVYDLTIVARPAPATHGSRMTTLEAVLFDSGRPILIAPPTPPKTIGHHVVVSWNQSTEAAHTVAAALPVLQAAGKVTILVIETVLVQGPSAEELQNYLAMHDIDAQVVTQPGRSGGPGFSILAATRELGGDLLVKSAYTQSRLRQMIFGGATSQILTQAELPVFMAN